MRDTRLMDCLFLHYFHIENIQWKEQLQYVEDLWHSIHLTPHMAGVRGDHYGWSTYAQSYKGMKRKAEKFNYEKIGRFYASVLLPEAAKDKEVSKFISDFSTSLGCWGSLEAKLYKASTSFIIDKDKLAFSTEQYIDIAKKFQQYTGAKYGYYKRIPFTERPSSYYAFNSFSEDQLEEHKMYIWKNIGCQEKTMPLLRDVYELNFISSEYLKLPVSGSNLGSWIEKQPETRGSLQKIGQDFYVWIVKAQDIPTIYKELCAADIIVCDVAKYPINNDGTREFWW